MDRHADPIDQASEQASLYTERAIDAHRRKQEHRSMMPSEMYCIECEEEIPEARRAFGGVELCVECASLAEARARMHR